MESGWGPWSCCLTCRCPCLGLSLVVRCCPFLSISFTLKSLSVNADSVTFASTQLCTCLHVQSHQPTCVGSSCAINSESYVAYGSGAVIQQLTARGRHPRRHTDACRSAQTGTGTQPASHIKHAGSSSPIRSEMSSAIKNRTEQLSSIATAVLYVQGQKGFEACATDKDQHTQLSSATSATGTLRRTWNLARPEPPDLQVPRHHNDVRRDDHRAGKHHP